MGYMVVEKITEMGWLKYFKIGILNILLYWTKLQRTIWTRKWRIKLNETVKNGVFWDITLYGSCKNRRLGGT
jgi:hypothetical protein